MPTQQDVKFSDYVRGLPAASEADISSGNNIPLVRSGDVKKLPSDTVVPYRGSLSGKNKFTYAYNPGFYSYVGSDLAIITDKPERIDNAAGYVMVFPLSSNSDLEQRIFNVTGQAFYRRINIGGIIEDWKEEQPNAFKYQGVFQDYGNIFSDCRKVGFYCYYSTNVSSGISDAPSGLAVVAGSILNLSLSNGVMQQIIVNEYGQMYTRRLLYDGSVLSNWEKIGIDKNLVARLDKFSEVSSEVSQELEQGYIEADGRIGPGIDIRVRNADFITANENLEIRCFGDVAIRTLNRYSSTTSEHRQQEIAGNVYDRWILAKGWKYKVTFCRKSDPTQKISVDEVRRNVVLSTLIFEPLKEPEAIFEKFINSGKHFKVKIVGDSIAQGVNGTGFAQDGEHIITIGSTEWKRNPNGYCWANEFKALVESKYDCDVVNNACRGTGIGHLQSYWSSLVDQDDDIVICCYGTNDRAYIGSKAEFMRAVINIRNKAYVSGKEIIFVSGIPAGNQNEICKTNNYSQIYWHMEDSDQMICEATCGQYVSLYKKVMDWLEYSEKDLLTYLDTYQLHPNDALYRKMFVWLASCLGVPAKIAGATWVDGEVYRP